MYELQKRAGEEPFPPDVQRILCEPVDPSVIDIKPDGALFVPQAFYRDRLDQAFGIGGWAIIPLKDPMTKGTRVYYTGWLKARGQYIGDAIGGGEYIANNPLDTWDNCVEKAKSDCIVRCCKALPMFRECWDKEFCEAWKRQYADYVDMPRTRSGKGWKKKGSAMREFDMRPGRAAQGEYYKAARVTDEQNAHLRTIAKDEHPALTHYDEYTSQPDYYDDGRED